MKWAEWAGILYTNSLVYIIHVAICAGIDFKTNFSSPRQTKYSAMTIFKRIGAYAKEHSVLYGRQRQTHTHTTLRFKELRSVDGLPGLVARREHWLHTNNRRRQTIYVIKSSSCLTCSFQLVWQRCEYEIVFFFFVGFSCLGGWEGAFWQTYGFSI